jgi:hypothetical protein
VERGYFWESEFDKVAMGPAALADSYAIRIRRCFLSYDSAQLGKRGWSDLLFMPNRGAEIGRTFSGIKRERGIMLGRRAKVDPIAARNTRGLLLVLLPIS